MCGKLWRVAKAVLTNKICIWISYKLYVEYDAYVYIYCVSVQLGLFGDYGRHLSVHHTHGECSGDPNGKFENIYRNEETYWHTQHTKGTYSFQIVTFALQPATVCA